MTHRLVVANSVDYDFAPDELPLVAHRHSALVTAVLLDELDASAAEPDGRPIAAPFRVELDSPRLGQIGINTGQNGTFALVGRPWLAFPPLAGPATAAVIVRADGFAPLHRAFLIAFAQRTLLAGTLANDRTAVLNSTANLVPGQTLLFGPVATPQYAQIEAITGPNDVTLRGPLLAAHGAGEVVFVDAFDPGPTLRLPLRRAPVTITGRVVRRDTATNVTTPIANASVAVTDFWRTRARLLSNPAQGSMQDPTPALRQFALTVTPGVLAPRPLGTTATEFTLPIGDHRTLVLPAEAQATNLDLSHAQNLAPPPGVLNQRLLRIEPGDVESAEYQTVGTITATGGPTEPAHVGLELPLRRAHRDGATVSRVTTPAVVASVAPPPALRDAAVPGDRCLFFDALGTLALAGELQLSGPVVEFQSYAQLSATSDAGGYFRLPPVHRVARLALAVDDGAGNIEPVDVDPAYGEAEQRIDVVFYA